MRRPADARRRSRAARAAPTARKPRGELAAERVGLVERARQLVAHPRRAVGQADPRAQRRRRPSVAAPARRAACRQLAPSSRASARSASRQASASASVTADAASRARSSLGASLQRERALAGRRHEARGVEHRADLGLAAEPLQPGAREHDRVEALAGSASLRRRVSTLPRIATTSRSSRAARSCAAPPRCCSSDRAPGASVASAAGAAQHVRGGRARGRAEQREPSAELAGHVLGRVHGEVDLAAQQRAPRARTPSATCPRRRALRRAAARLAVAARERSATISTVAAAGAIGPARPPLEQLGDQLRLCERERARTGAEAHQRLAATARGRSCTSRQLRLAAAPLRRRVLAQAEQLADELQARVAALLGEAAQADRRLVQQPAHDGARDRLDAGEVARRGRLPAARRSPRAPARRSRCRARAAR